MNSLRHLLTQYWHNQRGVAVIEFALVLPMLVLLILGSVETTRYILLHQKMDKTAATMSNVVAQLAAVNEEVITQFMDSADLLMDPFNMDGSNARIFISSVTCCYGPDNDETRVSWQRFDGGLEIASKIGAEGAIANMPGAFELELGENVIIAEMYYNYDFLIFPDVISPGVLYKRFLFRPREDPLETIDGLGT